MKHLRTTARCPLFISRVDYQGVSLIQCCSWNLAYHDRDERDADYRDSCCDCIAECPIESVDNAQKNRAIKRSSLKKPTFWPTTRKYPTTHDIIQEAKKREREHLGRTYHSGSRSHP